MRVTRFFLAAVLVAFVATQFAAVALAAPALRPTPEQEHFGLGGHMEVLEDPTNALTIEDVASDEYKDRFTPVDTNYLNIGYTNSAYWVRFTVDMSGQGSEAKWNIDPGWYHYDDLKVYVQRKSGQVGNPACDGIHFERINNKMRMFKIESEDCGTYYIKFFSKYTLYIKPFLKTVDYSVWTNCVRLSFFVLLCSIIFVMITYNFVIFVVIRHSSYLYYVVAYFFVLLFIFKQQWNPITFDMFDRNISLFSVCFTAGFFCFMATSILDTKIHLPKGDIFLRVLGSVNITYAIVGLFEGVRNFV